MKESIMHQMEIIDSTTDGEELLEQEFIRVLHLDGRDFTRQEILEALNDSTKVGLILATARYKGETLDNLFIDIYGNPYKFWKMSKTFRKLKTDTYKMMGGIPSKTVRKTEKGVIYRMQAACLTYTSFLDREYKESVVNVAFVDEASYEEFDLSKVAPTTQTTSARERNKMINVAKKELKLRKVRNQNYFYCIAEGSKGVYYHWDEGSKEMERYYPEIRRMSNEELHKSMKNLESNMYDGNVMEHYAVLKEERNRRKAEKENE